MAPPPDAPIIGTAIKTGGSVQSARGTIGLDGDSQQGAPLQTIIREESREMLRLQCAWCHRFKGSDGRPVGSAMPLDLTASHGICTDCLRDRTTIPRRRTTDSGRRRNRRSPASASSRSQRGARRFAAASAGWLALLRLARSCPKSRQLLAATNTRAEKRIQRRLSSLKPRPAAGWTEIRGERSCPSARDGTDRETKSEAR